MTSLLIDGIGVLATNDPARGPGPLGLLADAALVIDGPRIAWVGPRGGAPPADEKLDAAGRCLIPGFVDSHAHLVFAGDRVADFTGRMSGAAYQPAGILATVAATRAASDEQLAANAARLVAEMTRQGTTTVEIKSGYGLTVHDEVRSLRVARGFTSETTFLGAHSVPPEHATTPDDYLSLTTNEMLTACAPEAKWVDVFCEQGAFGADAARRVLSAGAAAGLGGRVHANQLGPGPGVQVACEMHAASADHCTYLVPADVDALAQSGTVATLLPGAEFSTRSPYPDARALWDAGVTLALATDCNPGTSYTTSMPFVIALAVRETGLTPDEALWAATAGGARALRRSDIGTLTPGAAADLALLDAPTPAYLAYRMGVPLVAAVWRGGRQVLMSG